jgi:hypothetical protein
VSASATEAMPSAWLSRDGNVYLYRCGSQVGKGWDPCVVARAAAADSAKLDAYTYFVAGQGYVGAYKDATIVVEGAPAFTITWNPFFASYVEVYVEPFSRDVSARTASKPEGPFSDKVRLSTCSLPGDDPKAYCYAAFEHVELDSADAHAIVVTYDTNTTDFAAMIAHPNVYWPRLLTIDLSAAGLPAPPP